MGYLSKLLPTKAKDQPPKIDVDKIKKDIECYEHANKEDRIWLDNGRSQVARELDEGGTPNPHGLAWEVNEHIPNEIKRREQLISELREILKQLGK